MRLFRFDAPKANRSALFVFRRICYDRRMQILTISKILICVVTDLVGDAHPIERIGSHLELFFSLAFGPAILDKA